MNTKGALLMQAVPHKTLWLMSSTHVRSSSRNGSNHLLVNSTRTGSKVSHKDLRVQVTKAPKDKTPCWTSLKWPNNVTTTRNSSTTIRLPGLRSVATALSIRVTMLIKSLCTIWLAPYAKRRFSMILMATGANTVISHLVRQTRHTTSNLC